MQFARRMTRAHFIALGNLVATAWRAIRPPETEPKPPIERRLGNKSIELRRAADINGRPAVVPNAAARFAANETRRRAEAKRACRMAAADRLARITAKRNQCRPSVTL